MWHWFNVFYRVCLWFVFCGQVYHFCRFSLGILCRLYVWGFWGLRLWLFHVLLYQHFYRIQHSLMSRCRTVSVLIFFLCITLMRWSGYCYIAKWHLFHVFTKIGLLWSNSICGMYADYIIYSWNKQNQWVVCLNDQI